MDKYEAHLESYKEEIIGKNKAKRDHKIRDLISLLLILSGITVIAIPIVGKIMANNQQTDMLDAFYANMESAQSTAIEINQTDFDDALLWGSYSENQDSSEAVFSAVNVQGTEALQELEEADDLIIIPTAVGVIEIDKIDLKYPIGEGVDLDTLRFVIGHMPESAPLNEMGNAVMAGHRSHSFGTFFNRLDELVVGDTIEVTTIDGQMITYEIFEKTIVEPTDLSVLNNSEYRMITLITCHPLMNPDKRLIIKAVDIDQLKAVVQ